MPAFISPIPGSAISRLWRSLRVGRLRPDPRRVAAVVGRDRRAQVLDAAGHVAREPVQCGWRAEDRRERLGVHRGDGRRIQRHRSALELQRAGERLLDGDLLVEREPDQEGERVGRDQGVGVGVAGEREAVGRHGEAHDAIVRG